MIEYEKRMEGLRFNMELLEVFSLVRGAVKIGALIPVNPEEWERNPDKGEFLAVDLVLWAVGKGLDVPAPLLVLLEDETEAEAPPQVEDKPLATRERDSLLLIIAALADEAELDLEHPFRVASTVKAMLEEHGCSLGEDTIAGKLKAAAKTLKDKRE